MDTFQERECCVCMDRQPTQIFMPCKHQCTCEPCARMIIGTKPCCPMCRAAIASMSAEGEAIPIADDVRAAYQAKRAAYFVKAQPNVTWNGHTLSFEFDRVDGFYPTKDIMADLLSELGFARGWKSSGMCYDQTLKSAPGGGVIMRGPGMRFSAVLRGGAKPITEPEMTEWIKNCAFQHYVQQQQQPQHK